MSKQVLTTGEVAKYCGVNFRTVIRWIEKGYLKSFKLPGRGDNRISVENFVTFLRQNDMPIPSDFQSAIKTVLVIDDDPGMSRAIMRVLARHGFEVEVANSGFQAGTIMAVLSPTYVVLDLQMPGMDGFAVLEHIRNDSRLKATKVLVISALGDRELQRALESGADAVLAKPFENEALLEMLDSLTEN